MSKIGIIGPNSSLCSPELYAFGERLGRALARPNRVFICGGLGGFMEAVCKGVKSSSCVFFGQTLGILPGESAAEANPYIDVALPTGMGIARNVLIVRAADILIAAAGGAGTLSEMAIAWQLRKPVLCVTGFEGWAQRLAGQSLDARAAELLIPVERIEDILTQVDRLCPS